MARLQGSFIEGYAPRRALEAAAEAVLPALLLTSAALPLITFVLCLLGAEGAASVARCP